MPIQCLGFSANLATGQTYDASGDYGPSYAVEEAFNGIKSASDYWLSPLNDPTPQWLEVDFGDGNDKQIEKIAIYSAQLSYDQYMPRDFQLKASTTGAFGGEEDTLLDVTDYGWGIAGVLHGFPFDNSSSYRYYRLYILDVDSTQFSLMHELEMYECTGGYGTTTTTSTVTTTCSTVSTTSSTASTTSTYSTTSSTASTVSTSSSTTTSTHTTTSTETTYTGYTYPSTTTSTCTTTTTSSTSSSTSSTASTSSTSSTASTLSTTSSSSSTSSTASTLSTTTSSSTTSSTSSTTSSSSSTTTTTAPNTSFCVFRDVDIPEQSLITKANIYFTAHNTDIPTPVFTNIYFSREDNASPPTGKGDLDDRPRENPVPWTIQAPWYDNVVYKTPDLSTILQEIVDRPGFSEGNNVMAMIEHLIDTSIPPAYTDPEDVGIGLRGYNIWGCGPWLYSPNFHLLYYANTKFHNVTIPQGATITNAYMRIYYSRTTTQSGNCEFILKMYKTDDADDMRPREAEITIEAENDPNLSTPGTPWSITSPWTGPAYFDTPNFASDLQEIVDRSGWQSGNSVAVLTYQNDDGYRSWNQQDVPTDLTRRCLFGDGELTTLRVTWAGGSGTYYTELVGAQWSAQYYYKLCPWFDPTNVDGYRFWSAIEHRSGIEKACLRVHWRAAQRIQTPRIDPTEEFQLDVGFFVTMSTYPTDAAIYYTTNGTDPDENDTLYTGPIEINTSPITIKAKAYKQYWIPSAIAQKDYYILWPGIGDTTAISSDGGGTQHISRWLNGKVYMYSFLWAAVPTGTSQLGHAISTYDTVNDTYDWDVVNTSGFNPRARYCLDLYVESDGVYHIAFTERYVTPIQPYYINYATNKSGSWVVTNIYDEEFATNYGFLTLDSSGYVHLFHIVRYLSGSTYKLVHGTNQFGSWQREDIDTGLYSGYVRGVIHSNDSFTLVYEPDYGDSNFVGNIAEGSWGSWSFTKMSGVADAGRAFRWFHALLDGSDNAIILNFDTNSDEVYQVKKVTGVWTGTLLDSVDPDFNVTTMATASIDSNGKYHLTMDNQAGYDRGIYYVTNVSGSWQYYFAKSEEFQGESMQSSAGDVYYDQSNQISWFTFRTPPVQPPLTYNLHRTCLSSCPTVHWVSKGIFWMPDDGMIQYVNGSGTIYTTTEAMYFGAYQSGGDQYSNHTFYRFTSIDIPSGSSIYSAWLRMQIWTGSYGNPVTVRIWGNDVDDAVAPTTVNEYENLVKTSAYVDWVVDPSGRFHGETIDVDIKTIVQEIISRSGWTEENDLQIMIVPHSDDNASRIAVSQYNTGSEGYTMKPSIVIRWS